MANTDEHLALLVNARRCSERGEQHDAERSARRALALRPDEPMGIAMLALVLSADPSQLSEAAALAARAIAIAPDERHLRHLATSIALKAARFDEAHASAAAIAARWPGDRRALHDLALAANALGDDARVAALLDYARDVAVLPGIGFGDTLHDEIADAVLRAIDAVGGSRPATMSGGMRLDDVFAIPPEPRRRLRAILDEAVSRHLHARHLRPLANISRAWANVMEDGDHERSHIHENAALSGVYYPRVVDQPNGADGGALLFGPHHFGPVVPPLPSHRVRPRRGDVVLFPSHFPHATLPFLGEGRRISIAFDVVDQAGA